MKIMEKVPELNRVFPAVFFRYHTWHLWDRLIRDVIVEFEITKKPIPVGVLEKISLLAGFVREGEVRKRIYSALMAEKASMESILKERESLDKIKKNCEIEVYGFNNISVYPTQKVSIKEISY